MMQNKLKEILTGTAKKVDEGAARFDEQIKSGVVGIDELKNKLISRMVDCGHTPICASKHLVKNDMFYDGALYGMYLIFAGGKELFGVDAFKNKPFTELLKTVLNDVPLSQVKRGRATLEGAVNSVFDDILKEILNKTKGSA